MQDASTTPVGGHVQQATDPWHLFVASSALGIKLALYTLADMGCRHAVHVC